MTKRPINTLTRDEILDAIKELAAKLGRPPAHSELSREYQITLQMVNRRCGNYQKALSACGMSGRGSGYKVALPDLFIEWAGMVRESGAVPTMSDYHLRSRYSVRPLVSRFGSWTHVPAGLLQYAEEQGLETEWEDVLNIVRKLCKAQMENPRTFRKTSNSTSKPRIVPGRRISGPSLVPMGMAYGPANEMGVVFLFGMMAHMLGFDVTWIGSEFPDCEAMREVEPGRWQHQRLEFEFESRNFLRHMHEAELCDVVVCWEHNWEQCPLDVVELKSTLLAMRAELRSGKCPYCKRPLEEEATASADAG